jgi:prenylcysteine oxidase/farnesylcysteine lyase
MIKQTLILCLFILTLNNPTRVAIIGSGIGGSSAAHYLLKNENIKVDLYEKSNRVGGRVFTAYAGRDIDVGASFLIKANKLMISLINELNCDLVSKADYKENMSVISGHEILMNMSSYDLINIVKVIWKYGLSPYWVSNIVKSRLADFQTIYDTLENKTTFKSLSEMLEIIKQSDLPSQTIEEFLLANGVSQQYIDEMISALIAGIYNQHKEINAFAGFITLAGVGNETYSIGKGNDHLIQMIIFKHDKNPNFKLYLDKKVEKIVKKENLYYIDGVEYDKVIIACPLEKTGITFEGVAVNNTLPHYFQENYQTVIQGEINGAYFGLKDDDNVPNTIISNDKRKSENISDAIYIGNGILKVQSDAELPDKGLAIIKEGYKVLYRHKWDFAYPKLVTNKLEELPSFVLDNGLYYINAIETAGSCMELSVISARNIVNIIERERGTPMKKEKTVTEL